MGAVKSRKWDGDNDGGDTYSSQPHIPMRLKIAWGVSETVGPNHMKSEGFRTEAKGKAGLFSM